MSDITIYHATFHEGGVEITYAEDRDFSDKVASQRTIAIPLAVAGDDLMEALDFLQQVVDAGLTYQVQYQAQKNRGPFERIRDDSGQRGMDEGGSVPRDSV